METFSLYSLKEILEQTLSQSIKSDDNEIEITVVEALTNAYKQIIQPEETINLKFNIPKSDIKEATSSKHPIIIKIDKNRLKIEYIHGSIEFMKAKLPLPLYHFIVYGKQTIDTDAKRILNSKKFNQSTQVTFTSNIIYNLYFNLATYDVHYSSIDMQTQKAFIKSVFDYLSHPEKYLLEDFTTFHQLKQLREDSHKLYNKPQLQPDEFKKYLREVVKYLYNERILNLYNSNLNHTNTNVAYECLDIDRSDKTSFLTLIATINYIKQMNPEFISTDICRLLKENILDSSFFASTNDIAFDAFVQNYILNKECSTIDLFLKDKNISLPNPISPEQILLCLFDHREQQNHLELITELLKHVRTDNMYSAVYNQNLFYIKALGNYIKKIKNPNEIIASKLSMINEHTCHEFELQRRIYLNQMEYVNHAINTSILPKISLKNNEYLVESPVLLSSQDLFTEINQRSCIILSSGGTGKTTIANYLLSNSLHGTLDQMIYYLDLGKIDKNDITNKNIILKTTLESLFEYDIEKWEFMYHKLDQLNPASNPPVFTLFLDGLNEVSEELRTRISKDINDILSKNMIQIILFTRNVEYYMNFNYTGRLQALSRETIATYLKKECGIPDINSFNNSLLELLSIPYFLTKFSSIPAIKDYTKEYSRAYFLNSYYSEMSASCYHHNEYVKFRTKTVFPLQFYYSYFLPYIAYRSEKNNEMIVTIESLNTYIEDMLELSKELSISLPPLDNYLSDQAQFYTTIIKDLCGTLDALQKECGERDCIPKTIKFSHQYTRDYFASKFLLFLLRRINDKNIILSYFNCYYISTEICEMLNDLDRDTCISRLLNVAQNLSHDHNVYLLNNLFNLWTCKQDEVIIHDFKNIDFRSINLSKFIFSEKNMHSNFTNCTLSTSQFMPYDSGNILNGAVFNPKNEHQFIVASTDKIIKEFDMTKNPKLINTYISTCGKLENALYSHDGEYILACGWKNRAEEFKVGSSDPAIHKYTMHKNIVTRAVYSPDDNYVLTSSLDGSVIEYHRHPSKAITQYKLPNIDVEVNNAYYNSDGTKFVASYSDGYVREWKIHRQDTFVEETQPLYEYRNHQFGCAYAMYSHDNQKIVSGGADQTIVEIPCGDLHTKNVYKNLNGAITGLIYSMDSNSIYFCSTNSIIIKLATYPFKFNKINLINKPTEFIYKGHVGAVEDIDLMNNHLISAGWDEKINVYDETKPNPQDIIRVYNSLYYMMPFRNKDIYFIYSETLTYFIMIDLRLSNPVREIKTDFNYGIKKMINVSKDKCIILTTNKRLFSFRMSDYSITDLQCSNIEYLCDLHGENRLEFIALNDQHNMIYYKNIDESIKPLIVNQTIKSMYNYDKRIYFIDESDSLQVIYLSFISDQYANENELFELPKDCSNHHLYTFHDITYLFAYNSSKFVLIDVESQQTIYDKELAIKQVFTKDSYVVIITNDDQLYILQDHLIEKTLVISDQIIDVLVDHSNVYGLTKDKILILNETDTEALCNLSSNRYSNEYIKMNFNFNKTKIFISDTDNVVSIVDIADKSINFTRSMRLSFNVKKCLFNQCNFLTLDDDEDENADYFLNYYGADIKS